MATSNPPAISTILTDVIEKIGLTLGADEDKNAVLKEVSRNWQAISAMLDEFIKQQVPDEVRESETLSALSNPESNRYESGIICDSLEEVGDLLRIYERGTMAPASSATQDRFVEDSPNARSGIFGLMLKSMSEDSPRFVEEMVASIKASGGRWRRSYDYDGQGRFFKTSVEVMPSNGKYLVNISAAYVGSKPEAELAEATKKDRALTGQSLKYDLTPIGGSDWSGVDLEQLLGSVLSAEEVTCLAQLAAKEVKDDYERPYLVLIDGIAAKLRIWLEQEGNYDAQTFRVGSKLFLEAAEKGSEGRYGEKRGEASLSFSINAADRKPIVDPVAQAKIAAALEKIARSIVEKKGK